MEKYIVKLTKEEREHLLSLTKTGKHAASTILHAQILLALDEGDFIDDKPKTDEEIVKLLKVNQSTVYRTRKRLVEEGFESALSRKKHSRTKPRKITGDQEAHLIALCCSTPPEGRSRWTLKLLSNRLVALEVIESVSASTVGRALKKMN